MLLPIAPPAPGLLSRTAGDREETDSGRVAREWLQWAVSGEWIGPTDGQEFEEQRAMKAQDTVRLPINLLYESLKAGIWYCLAVSTHCAPVLLGHSAWLWTMEVWPLLRRTGHPSDKVHCANSEHWLPSFQAQQPVSTNIRALLATPSLGHSLSCVVTDIFLSTSGPIFVWYPTCLAPHLPFLETKLAARADHPLRCFCLRFFSLIVAPVHPAYKPPRLGGTVALERPSPPTNCTISNIEPQLLSPG